MRSSFALIVTAVCLSEVLFPSCISTEDNTSDTILGQQVLDTAEILTPIPVNFQPPISALSTYVYNDSIAVVWNTELAGKKLVELYNMNSNTLIKDYINVGNGPGEMISSLSCYSSDTLLIWDFMKQNLAVLPIEEMITDTFFTPELQSFSIEPKHIWPYKGRLIAVNPNCFRYDKLGINNNGPRLIVSDSNFIYKETQEYTVNTTNVVYVDFFISFPQNRIIVYNNSEPRIEIFDTDINLLKTIYGPALPREIEYSIYDNFGTYAVLRDIPESYGTYCFNKDYFYITYAGEFMSEGKTLEDTDTYILKFDWDGNFIDSYYIGYYVKSMSLSNDGRFLYTFGSDNNGNDIFYKYPMLSESNSSALGKTKILETFINIDYEKAYLALENSTLPDFSSAFSLGDPTGDTPLILYITEPDCSMCISEALDFIITYCDIETDCPAPFIIFKDGGNSIFEYYRQTIADSVDENTRRVLSSIHCINGAYFDVINNASDGAYLLYRNRTVGHLPWPPL